MSLTTKQNVATGVGSEVKLGGELQGLVNLSARYDRISPVGKSGGDHGRGAEHIDHDGGSRCVIGHVSGKFRKSNTQR